MRFTFFLFILISVFSCKKDEKLIPRDISKVEIENILEDSLLSIRAIDILNDGNLAFAANNNSFGLYNAEKKSWQISKQEHDSLDLHFRAVSHTASDFFMLSIANPALLFKTTNSGMKLVYKEDNEKVFYDSMDFWNEREGLAMGDPTDGCISIIVTRDGGETWNKIPCEQLPKVKDGEAAFAASDTNISIIGNHTWIATGGMDSHVMYSSDRGNSWDVYEVPVVEGKSTTGLYSIDFYDELNGFAIGGDYTNPDDNSANKILTKDGGKTWNLVGAEENPGYRSCVQYIPNRAGKELVVLGFNGIDYSSDGGNSWKHLSDDSFYTLRFVNDSVAYAAGSERISKLTFKE